MRALQELEQFQAQKLQQAVASYQGKVTQIAFVGGAMVKNPAKIQAILQAIPQVSSNAFAYTREHFVCQINLTLNTGEVKQHTLAVGPYDTRLPASQQTPILPAPLWGYCTQIKGKYP